MGRKYSIGSSLTSLSMTLTYLLFSIAPLAVALFLASPLLPLSCFQEVPQDLGSDHLPILLAIPLYPVFHPNERTPFLQFLESVLGWLCFLLQLLLSFSRGILISLSFLCCYSLHFSDIECSQIIHSFQLHQTPASSLVVC